MLRASPTVDSSPVIGQGQQLTMLKRQVERLSALVVEMLDISRITSGRLDLVPGPVDLRDVVREVIDRFDLEIQRRHVAVRVDAPEPVRGFWDAALVDRVVTNLMANALKYGAGRPVEVSVRAERSRALVVIRDHGVGIPDEEQGKICGPFARAVAARHHAGLGLGLWISEQIVQASGGRIKVDSRPEEGSTFTVELPLEFADEPAADDRRRRRSFITSSPAGTLTTCQDRSSRIGGSGSSRPRRREVLGTSRTLRGETTALHVLVPLRKKV
jgi:signal transduction histidine kinase